MPDSDQPDSDQPDQPDEPDEPSPGSQRRPAPGSTARPPMPEYKGGELDPERGPGLGCFWTQVVLLVILVVATPLSASAGWPPLVTAILLFAVIGLLLLSGQTVIFLLRLVAAERGQRRPLASRTRTVGELESAAAPGEGPAAATGSGASGPGTTPDAAERATSSEEAGGEPPGSR